MLVASISQAFRSALKILTGQEYQHILSALLPTQRHRKHIDELTSVICVLPVGVHPATVIILELLTRSSSPFTDWEARYE